MLWILFEVCYCSAVVRHYSYLLGGNVVQVPVTLLSRNAITLATYRFVQKLNLHLAN
jgi:hypothetical protein